MSTQTDTIRQQATGPSHRRPQPRRGRRIVAAVAAAAVAVAAVAVVLATVNVGNISIVSGWFPYFLFWTTVAVCAVAVVLRRDVLKEFAIGIPIGVVFAVLLFAWLHFSQAAPVGTPGSLYVWLCVACLVAGLVVAGWRRAHWPRRICGVVAVLLAVVSAGSAVNQTFAYFTTFDHLFGKSANHFLDNAQLTAVRKEVAKTGQLPDHGATLSVPIPGQNLKFTPRPAYVWVPPAWFARNHPQLPVIELLHGTPGGPENWTKFEQRRRHGAGLRRAAPRDRPDPRDAGHQRVPGRRQRVRQQRDVRSRRDVPDQDRPRLHAEEVQRQHRSGIGRGGRAF